MRREKGPGKVLAEDEKGINMQRAEGGRTVSNNVEKRTEVKEENQECEISQKPEKEV